jgi:glucose-6-phosphate 1-dehydrogenase
MPVRNTEKAGLNIVFVLFGVLGDLSHRLILPALYNLYLGKQLPEDFSLLGIDREESNDAMLSEHCRKSVDEFSRRGVSDGNEWQDFAKCLGYMQADITDQKIYARLKQRLDQQEKVSGGKLEKVFYLATPPSLYEPIAAGLGTAGLATDRAGARIVVEKPIGHNLESFQAINNTLNRFFSEPQIFRIDHFLGKETVQNILAMRFANSIFEPIWNRRYIDHVTISIPETLGVEHRGKYYEQAGALRDMVQNHLIQLLCLVAMEPPVAYDAEDIRNKKIDILRALRPIPSDQVNEFAARGQYASGWIGGEKVPAYREEPDVDPTSNAETYAALKLYVDNWRWQDVPFYMRTGKRLAANLWEISIRFRNVPHRSFPASVGLNEQPTRLIIQMQPEQGIVLKFTAKEPGSQLRLRPVDMRFSYKEAFKIPSPDAYETLLWDTMIGDATLFMRADQVEVAWKLLMPVIEAWGNNPAPDFPNYAAGSWGPESAELLVARDGRSWLTPTAAKTEQ